MPMRTTDRALIDEIFNSQRRAFARDPNPPAKARRANLDVVIKILRENAVPIARAISEDFGHRSVQETRLLEIFPTLDDARYARRNLARWMRTDRVRTGKWFRPARSYIVKQPLGVVGIVAPWNYPINLSIGPLIAALAAGNRAMVKMSELTPYTGALLAKLFDERISSDVVAIINGDVTVAKTVGAKPFDHLLFTGSTNVGREVMHTAAHTLTPVTLELGGKSPVIIAPGFDVEKAARRVMLGKCLNAGQTCIAPDYVLLPHDSLETFRRAAMTAVAEFYPLGTASPDYTSIVSERHMARLRDWTADAVSRGARMDRLGFDNVEQRKFAPRLLSDVELDATVMREEIFGPILPLVGYTSLEEALRFVAERPRPLAMYYFDNDRGRTRRVLSTSIAGGVTVNDTMFHFAQHSLPFGGVGASGMGSYHGKHGFDTFTKMKGVFHQSRFSGGSLLFPPFGKTLERLLRVMIR